METAKRVGLGVLAFAPIVLPILLFSGLLPPSFALLALVGLLAVGGVLTFIVHAATSRDLPDDSRILWILLFLFVGGIAAPIYYLLYVARDDHARMARIAKGLE